MLLNEIKPSAPLAEFVRLYRIIECRFAAGTAIPPKLYSPRPEQCLQFYPRDPETVQYLGGRGLISGKKDVVTGQHTLAASANRLQTSPSVSARGIDQGGAAGDDGSQPVEPGDNA